MADFKNHISVGAATGFAVAIISYNWNLIPNAYMAIIVFFATVLGSFLPDMDSPPGIPLKIVFGVNAYFLAAMSLYWMHVAGAVLALKFFVPLAVFVFVIKYVKDFFAKTTTHRGIIHSIPAWILSYLISLWLASTTKLNIREQFVIAFAVSCGYLSHLILDELWSMNMVSEGFFGKNDFSLSKIFKKKWGLKKSSGTALDLGFNQKERYPGVIAWILVIVFFLLNQKTIFLLFKEIGVN